MADFLALHGFTQRGSMWDELAGMVGGAWAAPDLPGHGEAPVLAWDEAVAGVRSWMDEAGPGVTLVGYSMGGRLALAAAAGDAPRIARLVLIGTSPGIADLSARERRLADDQRTAERIERLGVELFVTEWLAQPMFGGLGRRPAAWGSRDLRIRLSNRPEGLAGALRCLGQGSQPFLGGRVGGIKVPVVAVAGAADPAYVAYARAISEAAPDGRLIEVRGTGHSVVGENPRAVADVLAG